MRMEPNRENTLLQKNLFVAAGAGTGKTTRLAQEYLKRLLMLWLAWRGDSQKNESPAALHEPVERLLAITFTEKASSEMKTRIRQLAQKIQSGDNSGLLTKARNALRDIIAASVNKGGDADSLLAEYLTYLKKNLHKGDISTIHAFCARILREHPLEAGVDPEFTILDEREAEQLLQNAVESCALSGASTKTVSYLLQQLGLYAKSSHSGGLVENVTKFIKTMRSHGRKSSFLQEKLSDVLSHAEISSDISMLHYHDAMKGFPVFVEQTMNSYRHEKNKLHSLDYEDLQQMAYDVLKDFPVIRASLKQLFSFILVDEFQDINSFQRDIIFFLVEKRDEERMKNSLDYEDLQDNVLFVVGDAKQSIYGFRGGDVTVFEEARKKWEALGWQKETLQTNFRSRPPILDFVNGFFPGIMQGGENPFEVPFLPEDALDASPDRNFNSPQVLRLRADEGAESQGAERENEADAIACQIGILVTRTEDYFVQEETKSAPQKKRPIRYGDMAVLLRSLSSITVYQNALRTHNIPYHIVRGKGFYQSQEMLDVLNILRAVLSPGDEISLCGFLRSQFIALSDDLLVKLKYKNVFLEKGSAGDGSLYESFTTLTQEEARILCVSRQRNVQYHDEARLWFAAETFRELCAMRDRVSPSELLVMMFDSLQAVAVLHGLEGGEQKVANLYKLIEFARVYEMREEHTLHDFVKELERLYEKEPMEAEASLTSTNAVKLMTVHQAKGLEFPVVFVADMGWAPSSASPAVLFSPDEGFALKITDEETGVTQAGDFYRRVQKRNAEREQEEGFRIFYVACTRAKEVLFLCGEKKGGRGGGEGKSWSGLMHRFKERRKDERGKKELVREVLYASIPPAPAETVETFFDRHKEILKTGMFEELKITRATAKNKECEIYIEKAFPVHHWTAAVTALMTFFACERKFYYEHVLRMNRDDVLPPEINTEKQKKSPSASDAGLLVHKILQNINFSAKKKDIAEMAERLFTSLWNAKQKKGVISCLDAFLKSSFAKKLAKLPPENIFREQPFFFHVGTNGDAHFYVSGIMDLLYEDEDGFHILDYKFGEYDEAYFEMYKMQLYLYALAVRNAAGKLPQGMHIAFLKEKKKPLFSVDIEGFHDFEIKLHAAAEKLSTLLSRQDGPSFTKTPRSFCDALSCPFRRLCW